MLDDLFYYFVRPRQIALHGDQIENKIVNLYSGGHKFVTFSTAYLRVPISGGGWGVG